jgi:hypothetical protein
MVQLTSYYQVTEYNIDKLFIDNIESIPISGSVKVDNKLYGRLDQIILTYYHDIGALPIVLAYNKISDVVELPIGSYFLLPIMDELIKNCYWMTDTLISDDMTDEEIEEFENDVNGINKSTDNYKVNLENVSTGDNKNVTTASPKLNITLPKVSYNKDTGILTF